jgi:hypothetical protein
MKRTRRRARGRGKRAAGPGRGGGRGSRADEEREEWRVNREEFRTGGRSGVGLGKVRWASNKSVERRRGGSDKEVKRFGGNRPEEHR